MALLIGVNLKAIPQSYQEYPIVTNADRITL
jgi:hypothetical protein